VKTLPCDQIAGDVLDAKAVVFADSSVEIYVSLTEIERLVEQIELTQKSDLHVDAVSYVLELRGSDSVEERRVYELALRRIVMRRRDFRTRVKRHAAHGKFAPFAPR
jgi:hypothetical protein